MNRSTAGRKNYVLVHGAYHGGWCWNEVAERLRDLGHRVSTPTQTGLGERSHLMSCKPTLETFIQDIIQVLRYEDLEDVVLVGHSFAGVVISGVADRMPERLRHLVFLDALVLKSGESSLSRSPERIEAYRRLAIESSGGMSVPPANPMAFGISDPAMIAWAESRLTPQPLQAYYDALLLANPLCNGIPATYVDCTRPPSPSTESSRELVRNVLGWPYLEISTGHDAMMLMPDGLAEMLASIA